MTAAAIARHLLEFDVAPRAGPPSACQSAAGSATSEAAAVDEAFARGLEAGKAEAEAALASRLAQQKALHEAELAAARQAWVLQEGDRLAARLGEGLKEIEARIAAAAARALAPFLAAGLRSRAIAELVDTLNVALAQDGSAAVSICAAPDLLERLRARLEGSGGNVSYHPSQTSDVRVRVGQTVLEIRLGGWVTRIEEAAR
jgi:hypothetical protein